jgi:hypothetical protein
VVTTVVTSFGRVDAREGIYRRRAITPYRRPIYQKLIVRTGIVLPGYPCSLSLEPLSSPQRVTIAGYEQYGLAHQRRISGHLGAAWVSTKTGTPSW